MERVAAIVTWVSRTMKDAPYFKEDGWTSPCCDYFSSFIVFIMAVYIVETYLDYRQHCMLKIDVFPEKLRLAIDAIDKENASSNKEKKELLLPKSLDEFHKSRSYGLDKSSFGFVTSAFNQIEMVVCLFLGFTPYLWTQSKLLVTSVGLDAENEVLVAMMFMSLEMVKGIFLSWPFSLYSTFVIEQRHGFNKQTLSLFFMDKIKGMALSLVIGYPLLAIMLTVIEKGGAFFYLYLWAVLFLFSLVMLTIYPIWIMPLFNTFDPLPEGPLRSAIEALAKSLEFPLTKLFVCDGSKRSSHSNAYFYGFFKNKRIVLYDTLLAQANDREIVAILGHEMGHWKMWHTIQGFVFQQVYLFIAFYAFGQTLGERGLYASFGFATQPTFVGLSLFFSVVWSPVDKMLSFWLTRHTRHNEFEADAFSVKLGYGQELKSGLTKISIENLSNMNPDAWYSSYHYSHPPLVERLAAIDALEKKKL